jgi:hypothetical protein
MSQLLPLPIHNNTAVSRKNREIEKQLLAQLDRYVNVIRRELEKSPQARWTQLRAILIPRLHDSVNQTIRSSLEQSYRLGAQYVADKAGLQSAFFMTHNDIDYVKKLSDEFTDKFFARVQMSLDSTIRKEFYQQEAPDSPINPNFITTSVAVSATTKALAEGSRQKARSLIVNNGLKLNPPILAAAAAAADPLDEEEFVIDEFTSIDEIAAQTLMGERWVWVTAGDPCPICSELEGETWNMEDFDFLPLPPDDTHPNCRCRLVLA